MRVVIRDKRYRRGMIKARYTLDINIDYPKVSKTLPLTEKAKRHWQQTKSNVGYTTFRGLNRRDIVSILAAVKRQEAIVNVDRMGNCAYYKLGKYKY